jgi:hypothetical protein
MFEETFQNWIYECYIRGDLSVDTMVMTMEDEDMSKSFFDDFLIDWVYLNQHEFIKEQFNKFLKRISLEESNV